MFGLFAALSGFGGIAVALVIAVIVHEAGHAVVARHYGIKTQTLTLLPFGAMVDIDATFLGKRERVAILLAGTFANMIFALLVGAMLWLFPALFLTWEVLIIANAIPAIVNLLPIYPLDGGKVVAELFPHPFARKTMRIASTALFGALAVWGFVILHPMTVLVGAMMVVTIHIEFRASRFTSAFSQKKIGAMHNVAVTTKTKLFEAYKSVHKQRFTRFVVIDRGNRVILENELEQLLVANDLWCNIGECLDQADVEL